MGNTLKLGSKNLNKENWKVYSPNGTHMFTCGEDKASWYLERNLAEIVHEKGIKFLFEPNGYGFSQDEEFGLTDRIIQWVVTGDTDKLQRHHIVPYCYRSHLPLEFKSRNHHDIVLMRRDKHSDYEVVAMEFKNEMAEMFDVKTLSEYDTLYNKELLNFSRDRVKTVSKLSGFFYNNKKISNEQKLENLEFVSNYTGIDFETLRNFNYFQLYKFFDFVRDKYRNEIEKYKEDIRLEYDHGYQVVSKLKSDEDIENFIKMWRKHFIDVMNPQYMPTGWSIDFRCKKIL